MKTKSLLGLILIAFSPLLFAQSYISAPPISSVDDSSSTISGWQECNAKIQGGVDGFPWSVAKPFPWADIQGVWKLRDGVSPYYLKAKVVRTTSNRKILNLSIVSEGNCSRPIAQGLGYVDFSERNVVRAIMNDGIAKYQMKLASFDVRDLEIDAPSCGENVIVASIQAIGSLRSSHFTLHRTDDTADRPENMMLKKTSEDIATICRKLDNK